MLFTALFRFLPMSEPITPAGRMSSMKTAFIGSSTYDAGKGIYERDNVSIADITPETSPERMPSPESLTAAIPAEAEPRYSAQRDSGVISLAGSSAETAIAQKIRSRTADTASHTD